MANENILQNLLNDDGTLDPNKLKETLAELKAGLSSIGDVTDSQNKELADKIEEQQLIIAEQASKLEKFSEDKYSADFSACS